MPTSFCRASRRRRSSRYCRRVHDCSYRRTASSIAPSSRRRPAAELLRVPAWTRATLLERRRAGRHAEARPAARLVHDHLRRRRRSVRAGRASAASAALTAAMMSEGTATRDGDQLSNALAAARRGGVWNVVGETGSMGFVSTTDKFAQTLDILADMLLHPTFPAEALERLRGAGARRADAGEGSAGVDRRRVFLARAVRHGSPVRSPVDRGDASRRSRATTSSAFHQAYFQPGRALDHRGRRRRRRRR